VIEAHIQNFKEIESNYKIRVKNRGKKIKKKNQVKKGKWNSNAKRLENAPKTQWRMFKRGRDGEDSETWSKSPRTRPSLSPAMRGMAGYKIISGREQRGKGGERERERERDFCGLYI